MILASLLPWFLPLLPQDLGVAPLSRPASRPVLGVPQRGTWDCVIRTRIDALAAPEREACALAIERALADPRMPVAVRDAALSLAAAYRNGKDAAPTDAVCQERTVVDGAASAREYRFGGGWESEADGAGVTWDLSDGRSRARRTMAHGRGRGEILVEREQRAAGQGRSALLDALRDVCAWRELLLVRGRPAPGWTRELTITDPPTGVVLPSGHQISVARAVLLEQDGGAGAHQVRVLLLDHLGGTARDYTARWRGGQLVAVEHLEFHPYTTRIAREVSYRVDTASAAGDLPTFAALAAVPELATDYQDGRFRTKVADPYLTRAVTRDLPDAKDPRTEPDQPRR